MKIGIIMTLACLLMATSAFAWDRGDRVERYYDKKGDQLEQYHDAKGDRINAHHDDLALAAALRGNFGQALALDMKGDRIDAELDAKGERLDNKLDAKGRRLDRAMDARAARHSAHLERRWRSYH